MSKPQWLHKCRELKRKKTKQKTHIWDGWDQLETRKRLSSWFCIELIIVSVHSAMQRSERETCTSSLGKCDVGLLIYLCAGKTPCLVAALVFGRFNIKLKISIWNLLKENMIKWKCIKILNQMFFVTSNMKTKINRYSWALTNFFDEKKIIFWRICFSLYKTLIW